MTELAGNAVFLDIAAHRRGLAGDPALLATAGRPGSRRRRPVSPTTARSSSGPPQVMAGYWDEPEATAATLVDGWLHTGDIGRFDADGNLAIVDRKKDVILTGGENVSSLEVEQVLHEVPGGRRGRGRGCARPGVGRERVRGGRATCGRDGGPRRAGRRGSGRLAGFKVPRHVVTVDELPEELHREDREAGAPGVARRAPGAPGRPPVGSAA